MNEAIPQRLKAGIVQEALRLGFFDCRFAKAEQLDTEARRLEDWLRVGRQGHMHWMERHFDLRIDPTKLFPGAKTVIVLGIDYSPTALVPAQKGTISAQEKGISRYAWGNDYHRVLRKKGKALCQQVNAMVSSEASFRICVDSAPVMEKAWAVRSGIGWMGKNGNVITKKRGSFYFLMVILTDLMITPDDAASDHCGRCTKCLTACPTGAIPKPYVVDSRRCISHWTIEHPLEAPPVDVQRAFDGWMFGCDTCQDVCPWNTFTHPTQEPKFEPRDHITASSPAMWMEMDEATFENVTTGTPIRRAGWEGMLRNASRALDQATSDLQPRAQIMRE